MTWGGYCGSLQQWAAVSAYPVDPFTRKIVPEHSVAFVPFWLRMATTAWCVVSTAPLMIRDVCHPTFSPSKGALEHPTIMAAMKSNVGEAESVRMQTSWLEGRAARELKLSD